MSGKDRLYVYTVELEIQEKREDLKAWVTHRAKGKLSPALDTLGLRPSGGLGLPAGYLFIEIISFQLLWVSLTRVIRSS